MKQSVEMADKYRKEIVMSIILNGDQQARLGGKLAEISRQVFLQKEYKNAVFEGFIPALVAPYKE